jgi:solute carrier family 8 (sodium/calcium exchanger)
MMEKLCLSLIVCSVTINYAQAGGVCVSSVDVRGKPVEEGASVKDFDPANGGLIALEGVAKGGDTCPDGVNYPACKPKPVNTTEKCCIRRATCDASPKDSDGLYHIGKCIVSGKISKNGENIDSTTKASSVCGPVHVVEFPNGKMILEYNPGEEPCSGGMFLPFFSGEFIWGISAHTFIYAITLFFSFLGIAIIADVFMAAIEVITSKTKKIVQKNPDGTEKTIEFLVWNETIANLTLMALGSSAPEILLSVIETLGLVNAEPVPGGLGPGTIVGSAAFNLLVIIAICVMAIPSKNDSGESGTRKIKSMGVFTCTAFFSVFAYIWLFICVSDNSVDLWEAIVTFMFFPILVLIAYWLDKKGAAQADAAVVPDDITAGGGGTTQHVAGTTGMGAAGYGNRQDLAKKLATLKAAEGLSGLLAEKDAKADKLKIAEGKKKLAALAVAEIQSEKKVSVMQAKINARRGLAGRQRTVAGAGDPGALEALKKLGEEKKQQDQNAMMTAADKNMTYVSFSSAVYSVDEGKGKVSVDVLRFGNTDSEVSVYYNTVDGEAISGSDFKYTRGVVTFKKGEDRKSIEVELIDDNDYEPDECFYIELKKPKEGKKGTPSEPFEFKGHSLCTVTILNDDKPGTFSFEKSSYSVSEASGKLRVKIVRSQGSDGEVQVKVTTVDGSAKSGADYVKYEEVLTFKDMQGAQEFEIELVEDDAYEKEENFTVELSLLSEGTVSGEHMRSVVTIVADEAYATLVEEVADLMALQFENLSLETTTWADQFDEAMNIQGEEGEGAALMDYVMHFLTFGWKVMFATVPPTSYYGGWLTFCIALCYIGVLTAFVADIASIFGCLLGLDDAITAITFVALGTSLPDTFASKTAAVNDDTADASVGNVTGSNSVNVFLGLGLPWLMATIINTAAGFQSVNTGGAKGAYPMIAGSLGFSVVIFSICAVVCIATLYLRRFVFGYELGGAMKTASGIFFIMLWLVYVMVSSLETKGVITSFM